VPRGRVRCKEFFPMRHGVAWCHGSRHPGGDP
jgi:hypothetical protein